MSSGFSKYDRKETTQSMYCYLDTNILINKENIRNVKALEKFERDIAFSRLYLLEDNPIRGRFGIFHLKNVHKFIFQDVYPFAGKFRLEDIWKGDTFFCRVEYIEGNLCQLFATLKDEKYLRGLHLEDFAQRASF